MNKEEITPELVTRLISDQFPQWADQPITPVELDGWDKAPSGSVTRCWCGYHGTTPTRLRSTSSTGGYPYSPVTSPLTIPEPVALGRPRSSFRRPWSHLPLDRRGAASGRLGPSASHADRVEGIEIRVARSEDVQRLAGLRQRSTTETTGEAEDASFEARFARWHEIERRHRKFWLAEIDQEPVGMVNLVTIERMPRPGRDTGRWGYLGNMFVVAEHRARGIGTLLLAAVLREAREVQLERVVLNPSEVSVEFWLRSGFVGAGDLLVYRCPSAR